jgi:hypothetical protein
MAPSFQSWLILDGLSLDSPTLLSLVRRRGGQEKTRVFTPMTYAVEDR